MAVNVIDTLKPKNNGSFPIVEAADVAMPDGTRLNELKTTALVVQTEPPEDTNILWIDPSDNTVDTGVTAAAVNEIDALIGGEE